MILLMPSMLLHFACVRSRDFTSAAMIMLPRFDAACLLPEAAHYFFLLRGRYDVFSGYRRLPCQMPPR